MKRKHIFQGAATVAALLFWIFIWDVVADHVSLSFILPGPVEVFSRFFQLLLDPAFYKTLIFSLLRVGIGFCAGGIFAILLGVASYHSALLRTLISPVMAIVKATPVASFILVVILWIEKDFVPAFISLLMVLPIVWQSTVLGFEKRDAALGEMAKVFRLGRWKTLVRLDLPQVFPFILSSSKTAIGLAWKAGVAAEVLALPKESVGIMIYNAKLYLETVDLYAWTMGIILFSVILEKLFSLLFSRKKGGVEHGNPTSV